MSTSYGQGSAPQQRTPPHSPSNTTRRVNKDGDHEEEWTGSEAPGVRTHDYSNEDEVNEKLFGKGVVKKYNTSTYTNADGDREESANGPVGIRTHDHSNEDEINERLFGRNAPKAPSRTNSGNNSGISTYTDRDGNRVQVDDDQGNRGIRTHGGDEDEDAINERLFGKGARSTSERH